MSKKDKLDRFYTKTEVAKTCYETILPFLSDTDLIIEPSAGAGAFYDLIRSPVIGYDLFPAHPKINQGDWLQQDVPKNSVIIGNPPFGSRNHLTKAFIKHSISRAKLIGFILPKVFQKQTYQKVFPEEWSLIVNQDLPRNSFLFEGKDYHVPTCWQIWQKNSKLYNLRESCQKQESTTDFIFTNNEPSHFIFGAAPHKVILANEVQMNNRGYFIKTDLSDIKKIFQEIDWGSHGLSSVNGGVSWFSKQEIINIYVRQKSS